MPNININPKYRIKPSQKVSLGVEIWIEDNNKPFSVYLIRDSSNQNVMLDLSNIPGAHFVVRGGILYFILPTEVDETVIPGTWIIDVQQNSTSIGKIDFDIIDYTYNSIEQKDKYIVCPQKGYGWERQQSPDRSYGKTWFVQSIIMAIERFYWNGSKQFPIKLLDWSGINGNSLVGHPNNSHSGGLVLDGSYPYTSDRYKYPEVGLDKIDIVGFAELTKQIVKLLPKAYFRIHPTYWTDIYLNYREIIPFLTEDNYYHHDNHWHLSLI